MSVVVELSDKVMDSLKYVVELKIEKTQQETKSSTKKKVCPYCGSEAYYLHTLDQYYCFNCKKYIS
ncbi:MAG: hypothetical protein ACP5IT_11945 [Thermoproteota archaeon]|jgi:ribosomal protein S27AE